LPEFKARYYLKKQMELMIAVNVSTYDIKGAGRKCIALRLYNVAAVKDAPDETPGVVVIKSLWQLAYVKLS